MTYEAHKETISAVTIRILADEDPVNPRKDYDGHLGKLVCWHRRYNLGDEQPRESPEGFRANLARKTIGAERVDAHLDRLDRRAAQFESIDSGWKWYAEQSAEYIDRILARHYVILPLYLYDHSGITMSTGRFSCPWDSGQVGFIYVSIAEAKKEFGRRYREKTIDRLKAEVSEYDDYLTGNCWGYVVEDEDGGVLDSCWGFLGDMDYCLEEARSAAKYHADKINAAAARDIESSRPDMYSAA